ncbi:hypothetical protein PHYPSEUDO_009518 [Phytophthora pseudosyringae]|uniref:CAMKK/CAMKK-META protein kinase n=1 Tax=Phytophthora pseudosyringae TaxID=221518 RepID=A0A8T1VH36_9STRA|nr:hypothetical protein PHYPSEUDO_009518 [Phytophthora pseudosyringae]
MGCRASKPLPPPPASVNASSAPEKAADKGSDDDESVHGKPPSDALLRLAMEAEKVVKPGDIKDEQDRPGPGDLEVVSGSPLKSLKQQSILGDQQPEDAAASSMLPDVSYSMRGNSGPVATQKPVDTLDQPVTVVGSIRKNVGVQNVPRQGSSAGGAQSSVIVPLQQPQVARGPGWVSGPAPRGRRAPIPTGYRAPQGAGGPVPRGSLPTTRGRGRPIHVVVPGDRSMTQGQPLPVVGNPPSPENKSPNIKFNRKGESSNSEADDDSDEDIEKEDEEVEDWDLGEEGRAVALTPVVTPSRNNSPTKAREEAVYVKNDLIKVRGSVVMQGSPLEKTEQDVTPSPVPPRRASGFQPKFRPALDLADDIENVLSDSDASSDDSDDDDVDESDDCVHDWLDGPGDPSPTLPPVRRVVSPLKPVTPLTSAREVLQASAVTQPQTVHPNSRHLYGLTIVPPANCGSPTHMNSNSTGATTPLPPGRTPQPPSYRQGNMSPTRSAGANLHTVVGPTSPLKQPSYRSGIVSNLAPAVVPLVMVGDQSPAKVAASPSSSPAAAAIRDTKVVKKKKAELPQHNLPHPVPKFGDWLNSRTMINNYIILETLGTGGYAEVKLCKEKQSGKLFAMKFISRDVMKKDKLGKQSKLDDIKREIAIMKKLNHPNVLRLYEVMDDPKMNKLFLVLEFMKHGDMLSFQKKKHPQGMLENLRDRDLHSVFLQVILGLAYLHEQKIVHGDIKPQNLLVGEKDVVKIADFGISQSLYGSKQKIADVAGTPAFMSPEMCSGEEYSGQLADVWALGATIFMLKFGNPPFLAKSAMQMFERIQNDPLVFPSAIDPLLAHLLDGMLTKSPQKRLTLLDVMVHPWVTKNEKHSLALDAANRPSRPITVSKDEIERAVGANHIAIMVNIRKQMLKRLKRARERIAVKEKPATEWENSNLVFAQSPKSINAKISAKANKVFAATSDSVSAEQTLDKRQVLSTEEIDYRSQLFSRKKASNKNALEAAPPSGEDHFSKSGGAAAHTHQINHIVHDSLDDEDAFSDDDDELAVSQSPQLLDELLLTTLSMPPLAKASGDSAGTTSLFATRNEIDRNSSKFASSSTISTNSGGAASYLSLGRSTGRYDDVRFYGESPALAVSYGVSSLEGRRNTQEDRWVVFPSITTTLDNSNGSLPSWATETAYVGIYDGHGGEECANILHEQLHTWIFRSQEAPSLAAKDLQDCFESLDASVCDYLLHKDDLSGSTATGLVLRPAANGNMLLTIAHVGDCRLVLGKRDGRTLELTQDHRLTVDAERERVVQLGGRVVNNRVNGVMAITRAFGDLEFKGMLDPHHGSSGSSGLGRAFRDNEKVPPLLTAKPDVSDVELDPNEDHFLLLACDGLWDVLTSEEATAIFRERVELHGDLQLAAHELAQEGIRRYSNDNITVIAVLIQPPAS